MDGTKIIKNPDFILFFWRCMFIDFYPRCFYLSRYKPSFSCARIHFRSNFIPPAFFFETPFFPRFQNSLLPWHQIANGTTNQEAQHEGSPPTSDRWISHPTTGFFEFFLHKNGTFVRKNLWFSEDIYQLCFFGVFLFGNPMKGKKWCFLSGLSSP